LAGEDRGAKRPGRGGRAVADGAEGVAGPAGMVIFGEKTVA